MTTIEDSLLEVQQRIDSLLEQLVNSTESKFQRSYRHVLLAPAKRVRPMLAYITGDSFAVPRGIIDNFALAIELIHTATLVFDDLPGQDNADLRRGRQALHVLYGEAEAQMAGLAMIFDAEKLLAGIDASNKLDGNLTQYVNRVIGQRGLCLGQLQDLQTFHNSGNVSCEALDKIAELKTGKLLEASVVGSAMIAEQSADIIKILKTYTYHLGLAFQVQDDLLDYIGTEATTGKTMNLDIKNKKPSYVSLLGLEATKLKLADHISEAKEGLGKLPHKLNTQSYIDMIDYVGHRDN